MERRPSSQRRRSDGFLRGGRFRLTTRLAATFVGIVALHSVWDQAYGWAVALSKGVTGVGWAFVWPNEEHWALPPSAEQVTWFNVFYDGIDPGGGVTQAQRQPVTNSDDRG